MTRHDKNGDLDGMTPTDDLDEQVLRAARARRRLIEAPGLIGWVRMQVTPSMGGQNDGMPRAASREAPAPLRIDAVDDSDQAFARILEWVSFWAETLYQAGPTTARVLWSKPDTPAGFRAGVEPAGAAALTRDLTTWLLVRHDQISATDAAGAYFEDVNDIVRELRGRYPRAPRPARGVLDRACPVCDQFTFGASWPDDAPVDEFVLSCSHCGHVETAQSFIKAGRVRELLHELREEHADPRSEWWTKRKAVIELGITIQTLNRYITDGGLPTYTADGTVYVNTEELLELYRAKRMAKKAVSATPRSA